MRRRLWIVCGLCSCVSVFAFSMACSSTATTTVVLPGHTVTAAPSPTPTPVSMQLPATVSIGTGAQARLWAVAIVDQIVARPTEADYDSMIAWFGAEDAHKPAGAFTYGAGENNPLNLTAASGQYPGVVGTEPSGAGPSHPGNLDFATPELGVAATVDVIWSKYPVLAHALTSGRGLLKNPDPAVEAALSEWSGGGYSWLP